jgi:hypothetical protein
MEILTSTPADTSADAAYDRFLSAYEGSNLLGYYTLTFRDVISQTLGDEFFYFVATQAAQPVAILPGFLRRTPAGNVFNSLPFFGPNAGILYDPDCDREVVFAALFEALEELMRTENVISASVYEPLFSQDRDLYERHFRPTHVTRRSTQVTDLTHELSWSKAREWDIRKARRSGVETVPGAVTAADPHLNAFYSIYSKNCADNGAPRKPRSFFDAVWNMRCPDARIRYAFHDGALVGGLLMFGAGTSASYYTPAVDRDARKLQVLPLLIDEMATALRDEGFRRWNWERSPSRESGVFQFKARWGAAVSDYAVFTRVLCGESEIRRLVEDFERFRYYFVVPFEASQVRQ